jgi:hypothetical protein
VVQLRIRHAAPVLHLCLSVKSVDNWSRLGFPPISEAEIPKYGSVSLFFVSVFQLFGFSAFLMHLRSFVKSVDNWWRLDFPRISDS